MDSYWEQEEKKLKENTMKMFYRQYDQTFSDTYFHGYNKKASELNLQGSGFKISRNGLKERASNRIQSAMARFSEK